MLLLLLTKKRARAHPRTNHIFLVNLKISLIGIPDSTDINGVVTGIPIGGRELIGYIGRVEDSMLIAIPTHHDGRTPQ